EDFAARPLAIHLLLSSGQPYEGLKQVGCGSGTFDELPRAGTHGTHDHLWLRHAANRKNHSVAHFLVNQFDGPKRQRVIVARDVHHNYLRTSALYSAQYWICDQHRVTGA